MALDTMKKKFDKAKADYEKELERIGTELRDSIVAVIAPMIPEGWYVRWHQSDEQYNDEDYYFDTDGLRLISEREPRQGKLLKEEVKPVTERAYDHWGRAYDKTTVYGKPAEYEWILDDDCKKRLKGDERYEGPGVVTISEWGYSPEGERCGLKKSDFEELESFLNKLDNREYQRAFGDEATVRVYRNGKCVVE